MIRQVQFPFFAMIFQCQYAFQPTKCTGKNLSELQVDTIAGLCYIFKQHTEWRYTEKSTVFTVTFRNTPILLVVDLYTSTSPRILFSDKAYIFPNFATLLEISAVTIFKYISSDNKPYFVKEDIDECDDKIMNNQLKTLNFKCRLPYMNVSLPLCNSLEQVMKVEIKLQKLNFSRNQCLPCEQTKFDLKMEKFPDPDTSISLKMKTDTRIIVSEYFTYSLTTLVSEVGGSVGLFLGISLLSCTQFFREIIAKICNKYCV
uniref:Uncharacterized protein n=1 Tax=Strigamia maritima TaxID=126957 RepID=T1J2X2_STRMM